MSTTPPTPPCPPSPPSSPSSPATSSPPGASLLPAGGGEGLAGGHADLWSRADPVSPGQLAHELNNLLDGSLRSVGLVLRQLDDAELDASVRVVLDKYLGTANQSMRQMADVIDRYANAPAPTPEVEVEAAPEAAPEAGGGAGGGNLAADLRRFSDKFAPAAARPGQVFRGGDNYAAVLEHAVNVYRPALHASDIQLDTHLDPALRDLPAGATYTLLANAINNARQAIELRHPSDPRPRPPREHPHHRRRPAHPLAGHRHRRRARPPAVRPPRPIPLRHHHPALGPRRRAQRLPRSGPRPGRRPGPHRRR